MNDIDLGIGDSLSAENSNSRTSGNLPPELRLSVPLDGSIAARLDRAVACQNGATALMLQAGFLLLSVKAELSHGEFSRAVEERGFINPAIKYKTVLY